MYKPDVLAFPGQNTHEIGMGDHLLVHPEAQEVFDIADETAEPLIGGKISDITSSGPEADLDANSQIAVFVVSAAAGAVLKRRGVLPKAVAGHSLGEYSALWYAGAFGAGAVGIKKGVELLHERQKAAREVNSKIPGGGAMAFISGKKLTGIIDNIKNEFGLDIGAENAPDQSVISGPSGPVEAALKKIKSLDGLRGGLLNISGAYHSRWFMEVAERLKPFLDEMEFHDLETVFFANSAQQILNPEELKAHLLNMHSSTVRFSAQTGEMAKAGMKTLTEVGKRRVLSKFVTKNVGKAISIIPVETLIQEPGK